MDSQSNGACFIKVILEDKDQRVIKGSHLFENKNDQFSPSQAKVGTKPKKSQRGHNFTIEEDNLLVLAWLNTSLDAIPGTDQKSKTFWGRITTYYHEQGGSKYLERSERSLNSRWASIQAAVNKFTEFLTQIETLRPSGLSELDKIYEAKAMFLKIQKSHFQFEHCWKKLRHQPRWIAHVGQGSLKRKLRDSGSPSTPDTINLGDDRKLRDSGSPSTPDTINLGDDRKLRDSGSPSTLDTINLGDDRKLRDSGSPSTPDTINLGDERKLRDSGFPSTPDVINLGDDNITASTVVWERPLDKKAEMARQNKEKDRDKDSDVLGFGSVFCGWKVDRNLAKEVENKLPMKMAERVLEEEMKLEAEKIAVQREMIELQRRKEEREQRKEDMEIMMMDLSPMSDIQRKYFESLRVEILSRRMN